MKKEFLVVCLSCILVATTFNAYGQKTDSLLLSLKTKIDDSSKVKTLSNLAWEFLNVNVDSSITYGKKALTLSEELNLKPFVAAAKSDLAVFYTEAGKQGEAVRYGLESLKLFLLLKNDKKAATSYNNLANVYRDMGNFEKGADYYLLSIKLREKIKDQIGLSQSYFNLGTLYLDLNNRKYAIVYFNKALVLKRSLKDRKGEAKVLNNLGLVFEDDGNFPKAMSYYFQSYKIKEEFNDKKSMSSSLTNIGSLYQRRKMYDSALFYLNRSLRLKKEINHVASMPPCMIDIAEVLVEKKQYSQAERLYEQALQMAVDAKSYEWRLLCLYGLSSIYSIQKKTTEAYPLLLKYSELKDSIYNIRSSEKIMELSTKYETDKKESEIKILTQQKELHRLQLNEKELKVQKQNYLLLISVGLTLALLLSGYFYFVSLRLKAKTRREQEVKEAEENERLRLAKDIHDDLVFNGLSKIKFLSELVLAVPENILKNTSSILSISETSVNLIENMRDLIWALNPENTSLPSLTSRIREYSTDYLADFPIDLSVSIPDNIPEIAISKEGHRNIFFIVKECLQNIIKHSGADKIMLHIEVTGKNLVLKIADNGRGIKGTHAGGQGLNNIRQRAKAIGANLEMTSKNGFEIIMTVTMMNIKK